MGEVKDEGLLWLEFKKDDLGVVERHLNLFFVHVHFCPKGKQSIFWARLDYVDLADLISHKLVASSFCILICYFFFIVHM